MIELKDVIVMWLLAQIFIIPFMLIKNNKEVGLIVDFGELALVVFAFASLKLIGG